MDYGSWSVLTASFLVVLFLALCGVVFSAVLHLVNGQWRFYVRNIAVCTAALFPLAFVLLLVLLVNGEATFPWLATAHDEGVHLSGWHNYTFLVVREIGGFLFVAALFGLFIKYQHQATVDESYVAQRRYRNIALLIPFAYFLYGTMVAWDFEMTMVPGWHSAVYGAYFFQSGFHMFLGFFTVFLYILYKSGRLKKSFPEHMFNYMAQFMLAMTILWTYLYFVQYLIMWYGRFPEEMARFDNMMIGYAGLWWTFLTLKFIIPFLTLIITPNRHNPATVVMVGCSIVIGTWIERYTWISGSVYSDNLDDFHVPLTSLFDVVALAAVVIVAWLSIKWALRRYGIVADQAS